MLPHVTKQSVFAVHRSVERLPARARQFEHLSRGAHPLSPGSRYTMLHATVLGIAVVAAVVGALAR
jgi:hypothetical protein